MFFSDETQVIVDRLYDQIKSYFTDFLVNRNYHSTKSLNITISDSTISWLMGNHTYEIQLFRNSVGDIDHIKMFAQDPNELNNTFRIMCVSRNFLGMPISQATKLNEYILIVP